jgi:DNA invertase Pin-like site-specific DNA recombinase
MNITTDNRDQRNIINYKHAYGYVRWSSEAQTDGDSKRRQSDKIKHIAENVLHCPLINIVIDEAKSASKGHNLEAEWKRLRTLVGRKDVIIIEDPDRLTRKGIGTWLKEINEVFDRGAFVYDSNTGRMINKENCENLENLVGPAVAKKNSDDRTDRIRQGISTMKQMWRNGQFHKTGRLPFWLTNGEGKYMVDDAKAALLRRMYEMVLQGNSQRRITSIFNKEGILSPRSNEKGREEGKWSVGTIARMLRSKTAIGCWHNTDNDTIKLYPQVISDELYWSVQNILNKRSMFCRGRDSKNEPSLFKGIVKCSKCGGSMIIHSGIYKYRYIRRDGKVERIDRTDMKGYAYYRCSSAMNQIACDKCGIEKNIFDNSIRELLKHTDIIKKLIDSENKSLKPITLDVLEAKLIDSKKKQSALTDLITDNLDEVGKSKNLLLKLESMEAEDKKLEEQIAIERASYQGNLPVLSALKDYQEYFENKWDDPTARLQIRELIRSMIDKIVCDTKSKSYEVLFREATKPVLIKLIYNKCKQCIGYRIDGMEFLNHPKNVMNIKVPLSALKKTDENQWKLNVE